MPGNSIGTMHPSPLEPLFAPWEEPSAHRVKAERKGDPARRVSTRRPSKIALAQNLRGAVRQWREAFYAGASDTSRYLLNHWFERSHRSTQNPNEEFRYYFCQREAIETMIYLKEVRGFNALSQIIGEFGGLTKEIDALGVTEEEDAWRRYAFKLATGSGKTKVMSLTVVWSYFHALRESGSDMTRHFVVIAPNLTVYERLREDFKPDEGGPDIFDKDPLIPSEWRGDWNLSVVLQDEAGGAATGGVFYLTNIHRLYDPNKRRGRKEPETYAWAGPRVSKSKALDTGEALLERITRHPRVMVLNDEAHHLWDPDSAWNEAIAHLHREIQQRGGDGLVAQLDFSATPKDNTAQWFKHIICDFPLGEAVDAGIVKTPIIGKTDEGLHEQPDENAAYKYEMHLRLGYERWKKSRDEWKGSGKKALLFVMCGDTTAADQIAHRFSTDETFKDLNGSTINLHTNLKGKIKKVGKGVNAKVVFEESEKEISDDDLRTLRKLSRDLDRDTSHYQCIVSVLMLREGWDVRNVTTIVPLRPYTSIANILPEQTLGRGLRRMTPPVGGAHEIVTVVDHPAFASLYQQELEQEGVLIETIDSDKVPATTVSIFPDPINKDVPALEILLPRISGGLSLKQSVEGLTLGDVRKEFKKYQLLPLTNKSPKSELEYEGRTLFTDEVIERFKLQIKLLESGVGAVSYYVKQLETICRVRSTHQVLGPLMQTFLEEILFERKATLFDPSLVSRLGDPDVAEHIRAVFVPLIRAKTVKVETRSPMAEPVALSSWKPYQATNSENHPVLEAARTLFNLVPCNRSLEVGLTRYVERASDVAAFAKNAGPQSLRVDYLASGGRLAFYTPDFFVRTKTGNHYLVETKGREDKDVARKGRAAAAWCESASAGGAKWEYVYVPQGIFEGLRAESFDELVRTCRPALQGLLQEPQLEELPLFATISEVAEKALGIEGFVNPEVFKELPERYQKAAKQAVDLFRFFENKPGMNYSPLFTAMLGCVDDAARGVIDRRLRPEMPDAVADQKIWFEPYMRDADHKKIKFYEDLARNLKRTLVFNNGQSPLGLLRSCLDYALNDTAKIGGVLEAAKKQFRFQGGRDLLTLVEKMNEFRNTYVAHQDTELTEVDLARGELTRWIIGLNTLSQIR